MPDTDNINSAIKQICDEKCLSYEAVIATIESALAAAYRKDYGEKNQNIKVEFIGDVSKSKVFDMKTVVEDMPEDEDVAVGDEEAVKEESKEDTRTQKHENTKTRKHENTKTVEHEKDASLLKEELEEEKRKFNPRTEIQFSDAKLIKKTVKIGDEIKLKLKIPSSYGRMAAQTAKQVIIQKLREAEREMIFNEFKGKEHEVVSGAIQRQEGRVVLVDLGKAAGILPIEEQIRGEFYKQGQRIKVYIKEVRLGARGPEIILSRTSDEILKKVFYLEIPEISNGLVEIKAVAREAGSRSKVAVSANGENVDPIGSCVGQKGARIQTIISELGGEKIDIIEYDEDRKKFISNSLSPAKVLSVEINEKEKKAIVKVTEDQLSLAIGKAGQNVRLAARLTGWKIDIVGDVPVAPSVQKDEHCDTKTQKHENTKTQKHENTETQKHENTETRKHKNTKTQKHENTETRKH
ncbi:transcription termination factor NusA [Patescibacteria group bacterium]|nr:transcription termination factor NusA [Patescibacteria group bacterium]MBU4600997.1 transcription termination factor NusA [Patescibacteria group bacterium]MCG2698030.1 transcription termination factor NusA [Candidatus Parcubacteria bacterium]